MSDERLTLNGYQIKTALEFVAPDLTPLELTWRQRIRRAIRLIRNPDLRNLRAGVVADELESELTFGHCEARTSEEGDAMPAGIYCWFTDYPEEGCIHLPESAP